MTYQLKAPFIRLIAFTQNDDGTRSVMDIVDTSVRLASYFTRRWVKDASVVAIGTAYLDDNDIPLSQCTIRDLAR